MDTYDTLRSGIPNAIAAAKIIEKKGHRLSGIRLDSGDLALLSKQARKMLDDAGLEYVKILASNQLNEEVVYNLLAELEAPIDAFGIGTEMITGKPDASLDEIRACATILTNPEKAGVLSVISGIVPPSREQAAEYLRVSPRTVYRWLREGRLQRFRLGNVSRIEMAALDRFVAQFTENTEVLHAADAANHG